jgi:RNA polymerase sigma-70 factor (ECF subfamily)
LGHSPHDAEDLTQSYFADLVSRSYLRHADPNKGRFRTFLIRDLKFHLSNEAEKSRAVKRGGRVAIVPLDLERAERLHDSSAAATSDPDAWFDRQWAFETVRIAKAVVAAEYREKGKESLFVLLKQGLTGTPDGENYSTWGGKLGMSEGAVKVAMHRLRDRFRVALREQILQTVASEEDLKGEMEHLFRALARGGDL